MVTAGAEAGGGAYLQSQLITFDQDPDWVCHELVGHLQDLVGQSGGDEHNLKNERNGTARACVTNFWFEEMSWKKCLYRG